MAAALVLSLWSCEESEDDFRYVAPGWEQYVGYTIEEVASSGFDSASGTSWVILDSELSKSQSGYDAFMAEVNRHEGVKLNFINAESVADNYFYGFNTIASIEMPCATDFGMSAFSGLPLTSLSLTADGEFTGPDSFNLVFSEFDNSDNCELILGVDEFKKVNITTGEWGGKTWLSICDTTGSSVLSEPEVVTSYTIDEMEYNISYPVDEIWSIDDTSMSTDDYKKLFNIINYQGDGSVWITLPNVDEIPDNAFEDCTGLYSVELKDGATIGQETFSGCSNLMSIGNIETIEALPFRTFYKCTSLRSIELSAATDLGEDLFRGCNSLTTVSLKPTIGVKSSETTTGEVVLGKNAFRDCTALTTVENLDNVSSYDTYVFNGCTALTSIEIPATTLANFLFYGCSNLKSVTLPNCTTLPKSAFAYCTSLTELNLTCDETISVNSSAFDNFDPSKCTLTLGATETATIKSVGVWRDFTWLKILDSQGNEVIPEPDMELEPGIDGSTGSGNM